MKIYLFVILLIHFSVTSTFSQSASPEYTVYIKKADSSFLEKNYEQTIRYYIKAFDSNRGLGTIRDRYKMAICFVKLAKYDSAFVQLTRIAEKGKFSDIDLISGDINFAPLHKDARWQIILDRVTANKREKENG